MPALSQMKAESYLRADNARLREALRKSERAIEGFLNQASAQEIRDSFWELKQAHLIARAALNQDKE